jgi:hypothetical protein
MKQGIGVISDINMQKMQTLSRDVTVSSEVAATCVIKHFKIKQVFFLVIYCTSTMCMLLQDGYFFVIVLLP